jgi:hypothetical protein
MYTSLEGIDQPIVALACQNFTGEFHFIYPDTPMKLSDLDFQDDLLHVGNLFIPFDFINSVIICTEETLQKLKENFVNA